MLSLIEAIGGKGRIVVAFGPRVGHAYAEVWIGDSKRHVSDLAYWLRGYANTRQRLRDKLKSWILGEYNNIHYHVSKDGYWLNLDWSAKYPGGPFFPNTKAFVVYPGPEWKIEGYPEGL